MVGMQQRGFHGIGISALLVEAKAPKGVLYHHFPGGKTALAVAAIEAATTQLAHNLSALSQQYPNPLELLQVWFKSSEQQLQKSRFERGCPLGTVALETTSDDPEIRQALAHAFASIRHQIAKLLEKNGLAHPQALSMAALIVAMYEGGLMQARVAGDVQPLQDALTALVPLLNMVLAAHCSPSPQQESS